MRTQIQKWGNSLALRIPKSFAADSKIEEGSIVDMSLVKGKLVIEPIYEPTYTLDELLAGITKKNIHAEVDTGRSVGKEVW
jgi:antitoxin MazE